LHSMISINSLSFNFLSVQFQYRLSYLPKLYQKIFISGGNSFSSPDYYSMNFGYGLGIQLPVESVAVQLWLNCTTSTLYTVTSESGYAFKDLIQFSFSEINYFNLNGNGNIQLGVGVNLYVKQFEVEGRKTQLSIQAGVNFAL
jgi:hypothetical protein